MGCLLYVPQLGTEPETQACALTGTQTLGPSFCGMTYNPLSHTGQGAVCFHLL